MQKIKILRVLIFGQAELRGLRYTSENTRYFLSPDLVQTCAAGREALGAARTRIELGWLDGDILPCVGCKSHSSCKAVRMKVFMQVLDPLRARGPLGHWDRKWSAMFCASCAFAGRKEFGKGR